MSHQLADWTEGVARLVVTTCSSCGSSWYLPVEHCVQCGSTRTSDAEARGTGQCLAVTRLHVTVDAGDPITLALVELDEGIVVMGRVHDGLAPGESVQLRFVMVGGEQAVLPSFGRRT